MSDPLFVVGGSYVTSPREIVPGKLYQGGVLEATSICESKGRIDRLGLRAIITVAHDIQVKVPSTLVHLHLPVDETNPTSFKWFDLAAGLGIYPAFIHCMAGANRSRVFAAAIAYRVFKLPLEKAIELADPPPSGIVFESMMKWAKG